MFYIAEVDNDATAKRDEGPHQPFYRICSLADQIAVTLDCRYLIPALIFMLRLFDITVKRTISCHTDRISCRP